MTKSIIEFESDLMLPGQGPSSSRLAETPKALDELAVVDLNNPDGLDSNRQPMSTPQGRPNKSLTLILLENKTQ